MIKRYLIYASYYRIGLHVCAFGFFVVALFGLLTIFRIKVSPKPVEAKTTRKSFYNKGGIIGESNERLLVKFKSTVTETQKSQFMAKYKMTKRETLQKTKSEFLTLSGSSNVSTLVDTIKTADRNLIDYIEKDVLLSPVSVPNDPYFSFESGLSWHSYKLQVPHAWDITKATNVIVGVCDTGFDGTHPDLESAFISELGYNTADNSTNWTPVSSHGTGVAGIIGAVANNGLGGAGIGWGVRMIPVRVTNIPGGGAWGSDIAECIIYQADHGAKVINVSYRYGTNETVNQAAIYAGSKGASVVFSAGNEATEMSYVSYDSIIAVSAVDQTDRLAWFSAWGNYVDVSAPGVNIITSFDNPPHGYGLFNGTSASAPVVSGVIALLYGAKPNITPAEVRQILATTSDDLGIPGPDIQFGAGRINAFRAVSRVLSMSTPTPTITIAPTPTPTIQQPQPSHPYAPVLSWITAYGTGICCGLQGTFIDTLNAVTDISQYRFYAQGITGSILDIPVSLLQSSSDRVYSFTGTTAKLQPCTKYNVHVQAVNTQGNISAESNVLSFTTSQVNGSCQSITPTVTPTRSPTPSRTPTPIVPTSVPTGVCGNPVNVNIQSATVHALRPGGVDSNRIFITNNDLASCPESQFTVHITYPDGWVVEGIPSTSFPITSGHTIKTIPFIISIPEHTPLGSYSYTISVTKTGSPAPPDTSRSISVIAPPASTAEPCGLLHVVNLTTTSVQTTTPGSSFTNTLVVSNPNLSTCTAGISINYPYPGGWKVDNFLTVFQIKGGETRSVPITITPNSTAVPGYYVYSFEAGSYMKNYVKVYGKVRVLPL